MHTAKRGKKEEILLNVHFRSFSKVIKKKCIAPAAFLHPLHAYSHPYKINAWFTGPWGDKRRRRRKCKTETVMIYLSWIYSRKRANVPDKQFSTVNDGFCAPVEIRGWIADRFGRVPLGRRKRTKLAKRQFVIRKPRTVFYSSALRFCWIFEQWINLPLMLGRVTLYFDRFRFFIKFAGTWTTAKCIFGI